MKKYKVIAFSLLILTSSCNSQMAMLTSKLSDFTAFVKTKALTFFDEAVDEGRVAFTPAEFFAAASDDEFIPLDQSELNTKIMDAPIPQPSATPGAKDSPIPSIKQFKEPKAYLGTLFKKIYFNTDQFTPKAPNAKKDLQKMANYLKKHPHTFVFIEGHCDERASESYNQALGTKRAGSIRRILVNYGVNPNQLYSVSYGKEQPEFLGKTKEAYAKNRRVAFKIYSKSRSS